MIETRLRQRPRRRSARDLSEWAARMRAMEVRVSAPPTTAGEGEPATGLPFELADESAVDMTDRGARDQAQPVERPMNDSGGTAQDNGGEPTPPDPGHESTDASEPAHDEVLYRAARQAVLDGEKSRARGIYRELLSRNPGHVRARNNLALLLEESGDHDAALEELDRCLLTDPDNTHVLVNRGAVLGSLGRFGEAERDLRRVLRIEPSSAEAHFNLGLVISKKGLWGDAVPYLRRAIELDSSRAAAHLYLGEALNHVDDLDGALRSYQRAVELRPNNAKALYGLGIVLDRLNRPDEAAQMYRRSRELQGP